MARNAATDDLKSETRSELGSSKWSRQAKDMTHISAKAAQAAERTRTEIQQRLAQAQNVALPSIPPAEAARPALTDANLVSHAEQLRMAAELAEEARSRNPPALVQVATAPTPTPAPVPGSISISSAFVSGSAGLASLTLLDVGGVTMIAVAAFLLARNVGVCGGGKRRTDEDHLA